MWCDQLSVIRFFNDFPDARIIFSLRRPDTWLKSARVHRGAETNDITAMEYLLQYWADSVRNLYEFNSIYGNKIIPIVYEDLTANPEFIMKKLCTHIDIDYDPCLLTPTFCGEPIYSNSSFDIDKKGIIQKSADIVKFTPEIDQLLEPHLVEYVQTRKIIQDKFYS
jgi:hypothetical protein